MAIPSLPYSRNCPLKRWAITSIYIHAHSPGLHLKMCIDVYLWICLSIYPSILFKIHLRFQSIFHFHPPIDCMKSVWLESSFTCSLSPGLWTHRCSERTSLWKAARRWRRRWTWRGCRRWGCWARSSESSPRSQTQTEDINTNQTWWPHHHLH